MMLDVGRDVFVMRRLVHRALNAPLDGAGAQLQQALLT